MSERQTTTNGIEYRLDNLSGGLWELLVYGFGNLSDYLTAAEVVNRGFTTILIYNPIDRLEHVDWTDEKEAAWKDAVRSVLRQEIDEPGPDCWLVWDPGRDQTSHEALTRD